MSETKLIKYALLFFLFAFLLNCKASKETTPEPELTMSLEVTPQAAKVSIKNTLRNAVSYDLDYGDGTSIRGNTNLSGEVLGQANGLPHEYKKDGAYTITLKAYGPKAQSKTLVQVITIDFYKRNTSVTDFSLKVADNGTIKMTNRSSNYLSLETGILAGSLSFTTKTPNPTFEPDLNGQYLLGMSAYNHISSAKDTLVTVQHIQEREKGYFKGHWLDKEIETYETFDNQARTEYMDIGGGYRFLNNYFNIEKSKQGITLSNRKINTDSLRTNEMKYGQIRSRFKAGIQNSDDWVLRIDAGNPESKSIEILEINEVEQKKIIPEMHSRAFWITYRIKADFGAYLGTVDGTLKIRYLIY